MLNSAEHEILSANKYETTIVGIFIFISREIFMLSYVYPESSVVKNLRFISRTNFMLSCVEHEKSFITSGPVLY